MHAYMISCSHFCSLRAHELLIEPASIRCMAITQTSKKKSEKAPHKGKQKSRPTLKKGKALGQAPALPLKMWKEWLNLLLETAGPKIFFVVS